MKKICIFCSLICFAAFNICAEPLPLDAQSGSSTCRVTAAAGESEPPTAGDMGDVNENPENPESTEKAEVGTDDEQGWPKESEAVPAEEQEKEEGADPGSEGETGTASKQEEAETPGTWGIQETVEDPAKGIPKSEEIPEPEEISELEEISIPIETARPDAGGGPPDGGFIRWLLWVVGILASLLSIWAFRRLWMLLRFLLFGRSRIRFHGILTDKESLFISVENGEEDSRLVQDIIDNAGSLTEFKEEVMKEAAATFLPVQSRMRISRIGRDGRKRILEMRAGEGRMFRVLEKLEGAGEVEVRITCRGTGIDIPLAFRL